MKIHKNRSSVLTRLAILGLLASPALAWAHGAVSEPAARQYKCRADGGFWDASNTAGMNAACRQALFATGVHDPYPFQQWNEIAKLIAAPGYDDQALVEQAVPSGKLCSAANPRYKGLDLPSPDWYKTTVIPKDGKIQVKFDATAAHTPSWVKIYLSKPSYNPQNPLGWEDLEPIYEGEAPTPQNSAPHWTYNVPLPAGRTGNAVLFTHWQRVDPAGEGFYNCSDIKIEGNDGGTFPWLAKGAYVAQGTVPPVAGDTVRFRVMGSDAARNEIVDETLSISAQNQAIGVWTQQLATTLNSTHGHLVNVGIRAGNSISYDPSKLHDNQVFTKNEKDSFSLSIISGEPPPPVPNPPVANIEGPAQVDSGKTLTLDGSKSVNGSGGSDRLSYRWETNVESDAVLTNPTLRLTAPIVTQTMQYAARLTVTDAANSKTHVASHTFTVMPVTGGDYDDYVEGVAYTAGQKVSHNGANYACKQHPYTAWCKGSALYYEPGKGLDWKGAWEQF